MSFKLQCLLIQKSVFLSPDGAWEESGWVVGKKIVGVAGGDVAGNAAQRDVMSIGQAMRLVGAEREIRNRRGGGLQVECKRVR